MLFFTNKGKVYRLKVHELPLGSRQARGSALVNVLSLAEGEHPMAVIAARDFPEDEYLMFATTSGMVKKTSMAAYDVNRSGGLIAIKLKADDELVSVRRVKEGSKVILCSTDGKAILFDESQVRPMGRDTSGVRGINLKGDATVLGMEISNGRGDLVVITENGFGKRTPVSEYPEHKRGGQGVFTIAMTAKKGKLVACRVVGPQHELMIVSVAGVMIRVKANDISRLGRATQGVKIMNLGEGDHVSAMARMIARKKKAPKRRAGAGEAQAMLDLDVPVEDADSIDVGGEEEFDESLLDE
jgi:DNA gyrase subunit A